MIQIIDENIPKKKQSTSEKFGKAFSNVGQSIGKALYERADQQQKAAALAQEDRDILKATGINLSGIRDPQTRQEVLASKLKGENDTSLQNLRGQQETGLQNLKGTQETGLQGTKGAQAVDLANLKHGQDIEMEDFKQAGEVIKNASKTDKEIFAAQEKKKEALGPLKAGLKTVAEMRKIGKNNNLGRGSAIWASMGGKGSKERKQYSQLGKSLIALASTIPIRNQMEFETLSHDLYDPSLLDSEREGILNAMESIIKRSIEGVNGDESEDAGMSGSENQDRPPLSSFYR